MAYKALYRKYRPKTFDEVCGQEGIIKTLQNSIKEEKISHAYLFTGTRGTGKTTVAKIFAKTINCLNQKDGIPCGICDICTKESTDEIQDIIEIDAASNNGVDEIREIKNKVNLVPTACKYKVYIIDEVHMLSTGAFNALLKTLEEPPGHVIFILATTEPQKLPSTIISRCQRYDFKRLSIKQIVNYLKFISKEEKINIDDECLEHISKLADGAMRDAIGLLEQVNSYSNTKISINDIYQINGNIPENVIVEIIEMIINGDIEGLLNVIDNLYDEGKNFEKISENLMLFLRNMLIYKNAPRYFEKKYISNKDLIKNITKKIKEETLLYLIRELNLLLSDMKKSSNSNILFELFLFKAIGQDNIEKKEAKNVIVEERKEYKEESIVKIDVVKNEFTNELKIDFSEIKKEILPEYKNALINNTIALADKTELAFMQENWKKLQTYLIKKRYKEVATTLLDSKINAVSKDHILLTYKYESMVESHDNNLKKIEDLILDMTERKYKIVAITEGKWNELRPYYVELKKKKKNIDLMEEIEKVEKEITNKKKQSDPLIEEAINAFGEDLIEMEG